MVSVIQPASLNPIMPQDTFTGQKLERGQNEEPRLVVDMKENVTSAKEEVPREEVEQATEKMNRLMRFINKKLQFRVDEQSRRIIVKIIDQQSGEVLSQIPPEKILDLLNSIQESIGLLIDKKI